jgi:hypothetical protein
MGQSRTKSRSIGIARSVPNPEPRRTPSISAKAAIAGAVGLVLVGAAALFQTRGYHEGARITTVPQSDIAGAASTLTSQVASIIVEDAKSCRTPMAIITISKAVGTDSGVIRIRSGGYLSPAFTLTDTPQQVAIPFPTTYSSGKGNITIEGQAKNASLSLFPTVTINNMTSVFPISIWWTPDKPC